jgi:glycosyltransferase involved in cell wall biosynthesis
MAGLRWLFVTTDYPWPLNHGTRLRVYHFSRTLAAMGDEVSVLSYATEDAEGSRAYEGAGVEMRMVEGRVRQRGEGRCFFGPYVYDPNFGERLEAISGGYDVVVLVRPGVIQYAREARGAGCVVADMVDDAIVAERGSLWSDFRVGVFFRRLKFLVGEYVYEKRFARGIDSFIFVSERDSMSFGRRHGGVKVVTIPNGVDAGYFGSGLDQEEEGRATVMFLGNMDHPPNEAGARYLLDEIGPKIAERVPEVEFLIVGSNPSEAIRGKRGKNVCVTGWVEDVRFYFRRSTVVLLPMQTGTGIKNKLLEAWASGKAVVGTSLACQGVPARDGENILMGETAGELADATVRLLEDESLRKKIGAAGRATVEERLTWEKMGEELRGKILNRQDAKKRRGEKV